MSQILNLKNRLADFEFSFDGSTLKGTWYKWRTTTPGYQRKKAEKIAALPQVPADAKAEDAEKILAEIEKTIREINARIMADTIKSWDAVEELSRTVTKDDYEDLSPRLKRLYKLVNADDDSLGYEIVNQADANGPRPVPIDVEVFEELPTAFNRTLGEYFQKLRDETVNPTKSDSSQSG